MEEFSSKSAWEFEMLKKWLEIMELGEAFRVNHIANFKEVEIRNLYVAKLTRLWLELLPKVEGRTEFGADFIQNFLAFRPYYYDPGSFFDKEGNARIYELEECLRTVLDKLKIT